MFIDNLTDKHVVIVGGSSGIGLATATLVNQLGGRVSLTGLQEEKAQQVARLLGPRVQAFALNINDEAQVDRFFDSIPAIDHVYIAAGSTKLGPVLAGHLDEHLQAFDERVRGSLRVVRGAVPKMTWGGSVTFTGGYQLTGP